MSEQTYNTRNTTNLGQLKRAMARSHNEVTDLAAIVYGVIEDMILQADITIPTSAWAANEDETTLTEGYAYKADVAVTGLIENANVNVTLSVPSLAIARKAEMAKTATVSAGSIRFYAKTIPESTMTGKLDAIQLAESEEEPE